MIFKSRKDIIFQIIVFALCGIFITIVFVNFYQSGFENTPSFWSNMVLLSMSGFLLWLYFGTKYEITPTQIKYKSGPIRGAIKINQITEIIKDKTLWSGLKPATARNGLVVKYGNYNEIYISPETNDTFVIKILELKPDIKITKTSNSN